MNYHFKRALGILLVFYVATFVVGVIIGFLTSQNMVSLNTISNLMWYFGIIINITLVSLFTRWYFANKAIIPSAKNGALFGVTAVILSTVIDLIIFSFANMHGAGVDLGTYYSNPKFWLIVALSIGAATVVGHLKGKRNR